MEQPKEVVFPTLISISRSTGNGFIFEWGFFKEFAFTIPHGLRRLADAIETSTVEVKGPLPTAYEPGVLAFHPERKCTWPEGECRYIHDGAYPSGEYERG